MVKITEENSGGLKAVTYSIDQGGNPLAATSASFEHGVFKYAIEMIDGTYEGKMSADSNSIVGTWKQGPNPLPLVLARATPETAWAIPAPLPQIPPMAANADPSFQVATIKPSKPGQQGKGFGFRGREFTTMNTNVNDLIAFAYGLHAKQIVGAPDWFSTELYDIAGVPDVPGRPNLKQSGIMMQKLLADRFQLKFHHEKKVLSVYAVTVAHDGPKMKKSTAGPNDGEGFMFRGLGDLIVRNMTMADFATWMQSGVMDKAGRGSNRANGPIRFPVEMDTGRISIRAIPRDRRQDAGDEQRPERAARPLHRDSGATRAEDGCHQGP